MEDLFTDELKEIKEGCNILLSRIDTLISLREEELKEREKQRKLMKYLTDMPQDVKEILAGIKENKKEKDAPFEEDLYLRKTKESNETSIAGKSSDMSLKPALDAITEVAVVNEETLEEPIFEVNRSVTLIDDRKEIMAKLKEEGMLDLFSGDELTSLVGAEGYLTEFNGLYQIDIKGVGIFVICKSIIKE